jgi:hypothetical protein
VLRSVSLSQCFVNVLLSISAKECFVFSMFCSCALKVNVDGSVLECIVLLSLRIDVQEYGCWSVCGRFG